MLGVIQKQQSRVYDCSTVTEGEVIDLRLEK